MQAIEAAPISPVQFKDEPEIQTVGYSKNLKDRHCLFCDSPLLVQHKISQYVFNKRYFHDDCYHDRTNFEKLGISLPSRKIVYDQDFTIVEYEQFSSFVNSLLELIKKDLSGTLRKHISFLLDMEKESFEEMFEGEEKKQYENADHFWGRLQQNPINLQCFFDKITEMYNEPIPREKSVEFVIGELLKNFVPLFQMKEYNPLYSRHKIDDKVMTTVYTGLRKLNIIKFVSLKGLTVESPFLDQLQLQCANDPLTKQTVVFLYELFKQGIHQLSSGPTIGEDYYNECLQYFISNEEFPFDVRRHRYLIDILIHYSSNDKSKQGQAFYEELDRLTSSEDCKKGTVVTICGISAVSACLYISMGAIELLDKIRYHLHCTSIADGKNIC